MTTSGGETASAWAVVEGLLLDDGVQKPQPALKRARERGCTPEFVRTVVEFGRGRVAPDGTRAWGPAAIRRRLMKLAPDQAIDDESLWLPVSGAYLVACEAEQSGTNQCRPRRTTP